MRPPGPFYFLPLESLRGIAALLVVIYHVDWMNPLHSIGMVRNGALMVDLFFVISGFVIMHSYGNRIASLVEYLNFLWLRIGRLYPLHLAFLFVFVIIELTKYLAQTQFDVGGHPEAFAVNDLEAFVYHLFLLHSIGIFGQETTFNTPSWSISTEFYAYVLFGALIIKIRAFWLRTLFALLIIVGCLLLILPTHQDLTFVGTHSYLRCLYGFFIGVLVYQMFALLLESRWASWIARFSSWILWGSLVFLIAILWHKSDNWIEFLVPPVVGVLVLCMALSPNHIFCVLLQEKHLLWLGKVSYSVYMVHMAMLWVVSQTLKVIFGIPVVEVNNHSITQLSQLNGALLLFVFVALVLLVSNYTYKWIEAPFRDKAREINPFAAARR